MPDISKEHAVETFKSIVQISLEGLKLLALFNGGAAVALLAYLGNVAGKGVPVPSMRLPMVCYVVGLISCGLAFLSGYLTQFWLCNESTNQAPRGRHLKYQISGISLSCHRFRANEVRLLLGIIAYNLGNLLRRLVLPFTIRSWSLTSLQQRLFKTGGRLIRHARYFILQVAESHLTRTLFRQILGRIERLAWHPT